MTSAFYIKERDNMPGMKGIYSLILLWLEEL